MEVPSRRCTSEVPSIVEVQSLKKCTPLSAQWVRSASGAVAGGAAPRKTGGGRDVRASGSAVSGARDVAIEASHNHDVWHK